MSINSPDLHVLVARAGDTEKIATLRERSSQTGVEAAAIGQQAQTKKNQQKVQNTPKTEGSKVNRDGHSQHQQQEKDAKDRKGTSAGEQKTRNYGKSGHRLDIKI
ncbi:MAG: hypothetical protein M0R49_12745 [Limnochordia bacterium]|nr:hypothetical protein [Limnochordia bacterium]